MRLLRPFAALLALSGLAVAQDPAPKPAAAPKPPRPQVSYSSVYTGGNEIAITFDDGPSRTETPRLLDMLAKRNIKATFYVLGQRVRDNPAIARRIVEEGHEIANHSWDHPNLSKLSEAAVRRQLQQTRDAVYAATGVRTKTFRPPYGAFTESQRQWAFREFGYKTILWSVDPLDWKRPGSGVITQRILAGTQAGGIVLAHDIHKMTVDAMPATLDGLKAKGFRFVTVAELLDMEKPRPTPPPKPPTPPKPATSTTPAAAPATPPRAQPVAR